MCGRYYIDSDMADEIEKVVHDIDQRIRQEHFAGDIFPTNVAPIIEKSEHGLKLDVCKWGYPLSQGKNLVINARAESVMDDRMPLILEKGQLKDWFDDRKMEQILHQVPVQLKREAEYEQQSLFL